MAKHKYKINTDLSVGFEKLVQADTFRLQDGYFRFFEGFGPSNEEEIYAVRESLVSTIERES